MCLSSAYFNGWLRLKGKWSKTINIIRATKYIFKFRFGGLQPGTPLPFSLVCFQVREHGGLIAWKAWPAYPLQKPVCQFCAGKYLTWLWWQMHFVGRMYGFVVESGWNLVAHGDAREGKWRGNWGMEWVASTLTLPRNIVYPALLPLMRTPRLPAVDWTDAPADLNGLVHFAERRNLVSARVPSHFKHGLPLTPYDAEQRRTWLSSGLYCRFLFRTSSFHVGYLCWSFSRFCFQSHQADAVMVPQIGHNRSIPRSSQFIIHYSGRIIWGIDSTVK
jgi:hypothetical protein